MFEMGSFSPSLKTLSSRVESPVVKRTLEVNSNVRKANRSLFGASVSAVLCAAIYYDLAFRCPLYETYLTYVEMVLCIILIANTIYNSMRYAYIRLTLQPVIVTEKQKKLLGFKNTDSLCKTLSTSSPNASPNPDCKPNNQSITPLNVSSLSWASYTSQNESNYSLSSPSWIYFRGSPEKQVQQDSPIKATIPDLSGIDFISDEKSLDKYLKEYETHEKIATATANVEETSSNLLSTFWSHPASRARNEVSAFLKNSLYQIGSQSTAKVKSTATKGHNDEQLSPLSMQRVEIWNRLKISSDKLTQWNANLRMWLSQTVLKRLVSEMKSVDEALERHGFTDVKLGTVGLERLRKTAHTQLVLQYVPTLPLMVLFLELSPNQEYLVTRIKELSKGGSMSRYRWNSGGSINGKEWEDNLPTDAEIVMHLLATYFDTQLLPLPQHPEARPFTTRYFVKGNTASCSTPDRIAQQNTTPTPVKSPTVICQTSAKPPHFNLAVDGETIEVGGGRNNLFQVILLFLYFVNTKEHGMLGRVNLGRSGINILWVIDS